MIIGDIETDGFLDVMTKIHCIVLYEFSEKKFLTFNSQGNADGDIEDAMRMLNDCDKCIFHNGHGFDYPVLKKFTKSFDLKPSQMYDSLTMAKAVYRDIRGQDFDAMKKGRRHIEFAKMNLVGSHSLKAWGYRLGELKGSIADQEGTTDWSKWTAEMQDYCVQDVVVTTRLVESVLKKLDQHPWECHALDNEFQHIMSRQERHGFYFNEDEAIKLYGEINGLMNKLEGELIDEFGSFFKRGKIFSPKRDNSRQGYTAEVPFSKVTLTEFNPGSRDHIQDRLQKLYGWKPTAFGANGKATVDERTLAKLDYPPIRLLLPYLQCSKISGMLAAGNQAWLKAVKSKRIHGRIDPMGTNTWRCSHSNPNLGQIPGVRKDSSGSILWEVKGGFGAECRRLFGVPTGFKLLGHDASGLELRCLAHYMANYDGGAYGQLVVDGDIHTVNQQAVGLNKRANAKTYIYAFLYGSGDLRLGLIVFNDLEPDKKKAFIAKHGPSGPAYDRALTSLGKKSRKNISDSLPALGSLIKAVKHKAQTERKLKALDGRLLEIRSVHSALNMLLQSCGAILMKRWLVILDEDLKAAGLSPMAFGGDNYEFVANVHDEAQCEVREADVDKYNEIALAAFPKAGDYYNFRLPIAGEGNAGNTWLETH
jgi:DNA polymerase I-like protein with 3'-5' exonuclease and polymerase domains